MVDEAEIFNAQCIDLIPPFICMKEANKKAKDTFGIEIQYFNTLENAKNWLISKN